VRRLMPALRRPRRAGAIGVDRADAGVTAGIGGRGLGWRVPGLNVIYSTFQDMRADPYEAMSKWCAPREGVRAACRSVLAKSQIARTAKLVDLGELREVINPTVSAANVPKGGTSGLSDVWQLS